MSAAADCFFFSSRRRHTRCGRDWSSDVCSSDLAADVLRAVAPVNGVARAFVDRAGQVPQLQIEIDRPRAARYGLNVSDVEDVIETELGGKTATELWEGERRFRVVVRLSEEERHDQAAIANVLIDTPSGLRIPLSEVATVSV